MPRRKCKRCLSYRPACNHFLPEKMVDAESITLLPEEIEALYLMDLAGLYQEDAAIKMEISRPTFARIIKAARYKIALALMGGRALHLETSASNYVVALCTNDEKEPYTSLHPKSHLIHFFTLNDHRIVEKKTVANPLLTEEVKPSIRLTALFLEHRVTLFITGTMGEGFKSMLSSKGIHLLCKEQMTEEEIVALW